MTAGGVRVRRRTKRDGMALDPDSLGGSTVHNISLSVYDSCPSMDLSLSEYREYCEHRLSILKWLDNQDYTIPATKMAEKLKECDLFYNDVKDQVSHFMLIMGFCKDGEKREWLIRLERKLFELRWELASRNQRNMVRAQILSAEDNKKTVGNITSLNKEQCIQAGLSGKFPLPLFLPNATGPNEHRNLPVHKVPFSEVPDLVAHCSVYIQNGYAYVPDNRFKSVISGKYRAQLGKRAAKAAANLNKLSKGPGRRLISIIKQIGSLTRGPVFSGENSENILRSKDIPTAKAHFPPCMRQMESAFQRDKHLKHKGRLTYGKFLKGCGMTCDDQIEYYRGTFTKKMAGEKFNKEYKYGIRHHYGMEGNKKNYSPNGCESIISEAPGAGEYHGCPFRSFDKRNLTKLLRSLRINDHAMKPMLERAENGHFNLACRDYFAAINKGAMIKKKKMIDDIESTWSHPNNFYNASVLVHKADEEEGGTPMDTTS